MVEFIIKEENIVTLDGVEGKLSLERERGLNNKYTITFEGSGYISNIVCSKINLIHRQYCEETKNQKRKLLYGRAQRNKVIFEVKSPDYNKYYSLIKKLLTSRN